ncbi:hypothetical protein V1279_003942 [Bradyrhizobium sp. AZCC 1610]
MTPLSRSMTIGAAGAGVAHVMLPGMKQRMLNP